MELDDLLVYYLWLTGIRGIGPVNQHTLLRVFKTPEAVYHASEAELLAAGLAKKRAKFVLESRDLDRARQVLEQCRKLGQDWQRNAQSLSWNPGTLTAPGRYSNSAGNWGSS